jgi:hypothetical protein
MAMPVRLLTLLLTSALALHALADEPAITPDQLQPAIIRALPLLERGAMGHREQRSCFSCHQQGVPILALATAQNRGFEINMQELERQMQFIAEFLDRNRQSFLEGKGTGGQVDTAGYALLALEQGQYQPNDTTAAVTEYLLLFQQDADHWTNSSHRPPSEASEFTTNYLGLRALAMYRSDAQQERAAQRRRHVRQWFLKAVPKDTEDHVFRLLAYKLLEEPTEEIAAAASELRALERDDGGWGQTPELAADAYATGTALFALHQAGGLATEDPVYQRGMHFLLKTQQDDGSWHIVSRSKPFQKYFETGFPHQKDQFISSAATAWATTALLLAIEKTKE